MKTEFKSLAEMTAAIPNEAAAIEFFTAQRFKNGAFCPYCGSKNINAGKNSRYRCVGCNSRFSIKVGTVMENTKIPVRKWLIAMWLLTVHKKGMASTTLARDLDVTQKTSWFMLHRLRHAARARSFNRELKGVVETDEAFFGGKEGNKHKDRRGLKQKAIAIGMLERGGELRVAQVRRLGEAAGLVEKNVQPGSHLMTDEANNFKHMWRLYDHEFVTHSKGQYVRYPQAPESYNEEWKPLIHTNSIEGYWSQLKRQIYGVHHWVSAKHLGRYTDESAWRYNRRQVADGLRLNEFIARLDGRITYNALIA